MAGTRYDLEDRLIRFAVAVCRACEQLPETVVGKHVKVQLVRSATSPAANYGEVQGAESRRDFIHKLGICLKELRETRAWLKFIAEMEHCPAESMQIVLTECEELLAIIASSIRTARSNEKKSNVECRMSNVQRSMDIGTLIIQHWTFASEAGGGLLSHDLTIAVPSALTGLTTVFGMGTGVALSR